MFSGSHLLFSSSFLYFFKINSRSSSLLLGPARKTFLFELFLRITKISTSSHPSSRRTPDRRRRQARSPHHRSDCRSSRGQSSPHTHRGSVVKQKRGRSKDSKGQNVRNVRPVVGFSWCNVPVLTERH